MKTHASDHSPEATIGKRARRERERERERDRAWWTTRFCLVVVVVVVVVVVARGRTERGQAMAREKPRRPAWLDGTNSGMRLARSLRHPRTHEPTHSRTHTPAARPEVRVEPREELPVRWVSELVRSLALSQRPDSLSLTRATRSFVRQKRSLAGRTLTRASSFRRCRRPGRKRP